jgi:hypothetical protein
MISVQEQLLIDFLKEKKKYIKAHRTAHYFTLAELENAEDAFLQAQKQLLIEIYRSQLYCLLKVTPNQKLPQMIIDFPTKHTNLYEFIKTIDLNALKVDYKKVQEKLSFFEYISLIAFSIAVISFISMLFSGALTLSLIFLASSMLVALIGVSYMCHQSFKMKTYENAIESIQHPLHQNTAQQNQNNIFFCIREYQAKMSEEQSFSPLPPFMGL